MKQNIDEWINPDPYEIESYFTKQWDNPYRSTVLFCKWLEELNLLQNSKSICDMGCGSGANSYYLSTQYKDLNLTGVDISPLLIELANRKLKEKIVNSKIRYELGDIYNISDKHINKFDGIILFQVLSWLPEYEEALKNIFKLNPKWLAFSCLLNEGLVEFDVLIKDYSRITFGDCQRKPNNVYSVERIKKLLQSYGYNLINYKPYIIDIDIDKNPEDKGMVTFTKKLENGERIQISGGMLLNWGFMTAIKE